MSWKEIEKPGGFFKRNHQLDNPIIVISLIIFSIFGNFVIKLL